MKLRVKIFNSFLIIFTVAILFLLPITDGIYDYRTSVRDDAFNFITTGPAATTANVTLFTTVYQDDPQTIHILSSSPSDTPLLNAYSVSAHEVEVAGLAVSSNRTLTVSYDVDALHGSPAIGVFVDKLSWIWLMCVIAFAPAAIAAIFMGRA